MRRMCRAVRQVKSNLAPECQLKWYLPGQKLPKVPLKRRDTGEAENAWDLMDSEIMVMNFLEDISDFVCGRNDEQLDDLLSERDFSRTSLASPGKLVS